MSEASENAELEQLRAQVARLESEILNLSWKARAFERMVEDEFRSDDDETRAVRVAQDALHFAESGDEVDLLLGLGADVGTVDQKNGCTALVSCARRGAAAAVARLVERGSDIAAIDPETQFTSLHWAAYSGHAQCVRALLDAGASDTAVHTFMGAMTALQLAQDSNTPNAPHADVIMILEGASSR